MDSTTFKVLGAAIAVIGLVSLGIAWEVSLWTECRTDHSIWYCLRVLGH